MRDESDGEWDDEFEVPVDWNEDVEVAKLLVKGVQVCHMQVREEQHGVDEGGLWHGGGPRVVRCGVPDGLVDEEHANDLHRGELNHRPGKHE